MVYFILTSIACISFSLYYCKIKINPLLVFLTSWIFITLLYQLRLSTFQVPLSNDTYALLSFMLLAYTIAFTIGSSLKRNVKTSTHKTVKGTIPDSYIYILTCLWTLGSMSEVIYSKGFPLLWKIVSDSRKYSDFGIPTIHGLLNAIGLTLLLCIFYKVITKQTSNHIILLVILSIIIAFYVALLTRQVLISAVIEFTFVYLLVKKQKPIIYLLFGSFCFIIIFGVLGNIRTGYSEFLRVARLKITLPDWCSGFEWVYMYLTMTVANVNKMVQVITNNAGVGYLFNAYLPSALRHVISFDYSQVPSILASPAFTVSGFFAPFYKALGSWGMVLITCIYGLLGGLFYKIYCYTSIKDNDNNVLYYAIILQITLLSFFDNMLLYLPNIFQLLIVFVLILLYRSDLSPSHSPRHSALDYKRGFCCFRG